MCINLLDKLLSCVEDVAAEVQTIGNKQLAMFVDIKFVAYVALLARHITPLHTRELQATHRGDPEASPPQPL